MANQQSPEVKAQHYIPKFYLKGFTDKQGVLWVCEKFNPIRASTPKHEAHRPDYYSHDEKGSRDETAENTLQETESKVAPIIRKLAKPKYILTPENTAKLIVFVAVMFARVPSWRENLDKVATQVDKDLQIRNAKDKEKFYKLCVDFERLTGNALGMDFEKLRQDVLDGKFHVVQKSGAFNLDAMFQSASHLFDILKDFGYQRLYSPDGMFFLTSDAPVYTILPDGMGKSTVGMGFGWPGVEVYFPLNKRACLRLKNGIQPGARHIEGGYVDQINRITMATAARYLYSSERYKRIARQFDEHGCRVQPGKDSFLLTPPRTHGIL